MTATMLRGLRTVAFGDVEGRIWGAALDAGSPALVLGADGGTLAAAGVPAITWSEVGRDWRLTGAGFELLVSPSDRREPGPAGPGGDQPEELCEVSGRFALAGAEHAVKCPGTRSISTGLEVGEIESLRAVSGWFGGDDAVWLVALRPAGSAGNEQDLLAATLFSPEGTLPVDEPRLSTSYSGDGLPVRANLELWIGEGEDQFPRRAAGEALGGGAEAQADGMRLRVAPLRCHSRGSDGAGVYLLARF